MENKEHNLQDKRCECCGYMTYHREHMGCIRAAEQAQHAAPVGDGESIDFPIAFLTTESGGGKYKLVLSFASLPDLHKGHDRILSAIKHRQPSAQLPAVAVAVTDGLLTSDDMEALQRFAECCQDCDAGGHDVSKAAMKRLERAGAVRSLGFGRHETTLFGDAMLAAAPQAAGVKPHCQHCLGSGVLPKAAILPEPPDVKCQKCNGTGMLAAAQKGSQ